MYGRRSRRDRFNPRSDGSGLMSHDEFKETTVVVTGSGHGLGEDFARRFAALGANVVVNDIALEPDSDQRSADRVRDDIIAAGGRAVASYDSVGDPDGARSIIRTASDAFGGVDVLVNNAAVIRQALFEDVDLEHLDAMIDVNLRGTVLVTQAAYASMRASGHGRIISLSSGAALFGMRGQVAYAAAKAGLVGMTKVLAIEGRDHGVTANVVLPSAATRKGRTKIDWTREVRKTIVPRLRAELVTPLVVHLARRDCKESGEIYSAVAGRYARSVVGVGDGWLAPQGWTGDESLSDHWAEIDDISSLGVPTSLESEFALVAEQIWRRDGLPSSLTDSPPS
ncbi:SDR family NAD(P)-dependent oxidoreductase [Rhodococcus sp. WS4]|nr:SDR family NAD(P)-dependent oxidoreductase [Rhodococcus sp. WS4]